MTSYSDISVGICKTLCTTKVIALKFVAMAGMMHETHHENGKVCEVVTFTRDQSSFFIHSTYSTTFCSPVSTASCKEHEILCNCTVNHFSREKGLCASRHKTIICLMWKEIGNVQASSTVGQTMHAVMLATRGTQQLPPDLYMTGRSAFPAEPVPCHPTGHNKP